MSEDHVLDDSWEIDHAPLRIAVRGDTRDEDDGSRLVPDTSLYRCVNRKTGFVLAERVVSGPATADDIDQLLTDARARVAQDPGAEAEATVITSDHGQSLLSPLGEAVTRLGITMVHPGPGPHFRGRIERALGRRAQEIEGSEQAD